MSLNVVYVCIFLVMDRVDCVVVNLITWTLFIKDTFTHSGKVISNTNDPLYIQE